jgi:hypothetical protein
MDLLKLLKEALRDPFKIKSTFIIFVNVFLFLIIGLTIFSVLNFLGFDLTPAGACDQKVSKEIESTVGKSKEVAYDFTFDGNSNCFFYAFVTWDKPEESINFWVYDPKGKVTVIEPTTKHTYNFINPSSPITKGDWKIVLKTDSESIDYTGEINFR